MLLPIQHITQQGNGWSNDCGPADVLMLCRALGLAKTVTVLDIAKKIDVSQDGTDSPALVRGFALFGVVARIGFAGFPRIEIVDYGQMPRGIKAPGYASATFLHWILRESAEVYHDPLYATDIGRITIDPAIIESAHAVGLARAKAAGFDCRGVGVVEALQQVPPPQLGGTMPTGKTSGRAIVRWKSWNVRETADVKSGVAAGAIEGELYNGDQFTVLRELTVGGLTFAEIDLAAGGAQLKARNTAGQLRRTYVLKQGNGWQYLEPIVTAPPIPAGVIGVHPALPALPFNKRLGVHMLTTGKPPLQEWLDAGCRSFTCMDNVAAAREARAAGAAAIYRRYIQSGVPDPAEFVKYMGLDAGDRVMVMGINEADSLSTSDLVPRFAWDKRFAEAVWARYPNCFPVIGSFSMGTPQIENPDVARVWRETYGRFLNDNWHRVGLNYHSYSGRPDASFPPPQAGVVTPEWLEMRHLKYGYDATLGALDKRVILVGDETGVDQQGTGGFAGCGYDDATFMRWWEMRRALFEPHPQQYVFNLFQANPDNERWAGYEVRRFRDLIKARIWAG